MDALVHCDENGPENNLEKQPRHYAAEYLAAGSDRAKQKAALAGCPVEWRELVKLHIKNAIK